MSGFGLIRDLRILIKRYIVRFLLQYKLYGFSKIKILKIIVSINYSLYSS